MKELNAQTLAEFLTYNKDLIEKSSVYKQYIPNLIKTPEAQKLDMLKDIIAASLLKYVAFSDFDEIRELLDNDKVETVVMAVFGKKFMQIH